ncbi:FliM/FliN family flagellar motor switch protein [Rhizobium lemnae]|uniref:FliM/FliN family flagellar motor switch protein n=1 Tax=Rhizobium lemnae TaxID=1214924 RepID=A0ABV8EE03_9HYPH|nr:FliM/FliN family flagellar motor switch protein [Rhizobium lemnae]MCJ8510177.1 FliM/FliN family flagellar motor switch protein [Rhizobium lemnae]
MRHPQALSLLSYDLGAGQLQQALGQKKAYTLITGVSTFSVRPIARSGHDDVALNRYLLEIVGGDDVIQLYVDAGALDLLIARREPTLEWDEVPSGARPLILEFIFEDLVRYFEAVLRMRQTIRLCKVQKQPPSEANAYFEMEMDDIKFEVAGCFSGLILERIWQWSLSLPREKPKSLYLEVALRRGVAVLTARQIRSLRLGDGIVLSVGGTHDWMAVIGEKITVPVIERQNGFELTAPLTSRTQRSVRQMMETFAEDNLASEEGAPGQIGDIPIKVAFNAGRLSLPISELENLEPGYIFHLERLEERSIEIVAQGVLIGRGKLITVEGLTAVQITALAEP